jgi:hypothetical protein
MKTIKTILFTLFICFTAMNISASNFMITAKMKNGDILTGKSSLSKINIKTAYGDLNIPSDKVTNIELGVITDRTKEASVILDLKKLQMSSGKEVESLYKKLLDMGSPILGIVKDYTENNAYQVSDNLEYSIESLLEKLYNKADLEYGVAVNDIIEFDLNNRIEGSLNLNEIQLQSNYGILNLKRENIKSLELSVLDDNISLGDNVFKLKGNKHISGNSDNAGWLNTGIKVKSGDKITITAFGKVVLNSLSGGIYGPDGFVGGKSDSAYDAEAEIPYGALVYKIGEEGIENKVGSKSVLNIEEDGVLFLSIYETVFNEDNTGSYTVKIVTK